MFVSGSNVLIVIKFLFVRLVSVGRSVSNVLMVMKLGSGFWMSMLVCGFGPKMILVLHLLVVASNGFFGVGIFAYFLGLKLSIALAVI